MLQSTLPPRFCLIVECNSVLETTIVVTTEDVLQGLWCACSHTYYCTHSVSMHDGCDITRPRSSREMVLVNILQVQRHHEQGI